MPKRHWPRDSRGLVIVAHPKDETIWTGGMILRHRSWDWTILSLCRSEMPEGDARFFHVCDALGAEGHLDVLADQSTETELIPAAEIAPRICDLAGSRTWSLIVTHGPNGEFGHPRHLQVHKEVLRLVAEGILECEELWMFAYECPSVRGMAVSADWATSRVELTDAEFEEKRRLLYDVYGYSLDSLEVSVCPQIESFATKVSRG